MNVLLLLLLQVGGITGSSVLIEKNNTAGWPGFSSGEDPPWTGGAHSWKGTTCTLGGEVDCGGREGGAGLSERGG